MLYFLLEKEFKQILRNSFIPKMIFIMPVIMLLLYPWAANQDIKDVNISVIDNDRSGLSDRFIHKVISSGFFRLVDVSHSNEEALESVEAGKTDIILEIGTDFERKLIREGRAEVMISANAVNGVRAGLGSSHLSNISYDYENELRQEYSPASKFNALPTINIISNSKFNPHLDYKIFMIPAIMVLLLTLLAGFLPALNIVGEKEAGTIEQMNVTPVKKFLFILSKLIPYWIIGFISLTICLLLAALIYQLYPVGSLWTIYLFAAIYILVISGMGLVISNYSSTMQQAMFVMYFFMMILVLMSGLFTPTSSMPGWAQIISDFNPLKYYIQVMRMVYLKGSELKDLLPQMLALCGFASIFYTWAVLSYSKSSR